MRALGFAIIGFDIGIVFANEALKSGAKFWTIENDISIILMIAVLGLKLILKGKI